MKTIFVYTLLFFFTSSVAFCQKYSTRFMVVGKSEFDLKEVDNDPEAEAVILFDKGESYFANDDNGFIIRFTRSKRIKILDKEGIDYAEISIPFYVDGFGRTEVIREIEAFTYNYENGQIIKKALDKKSVYEEKINKRWMSKKFVFPDVKEGSIIEYKYVLESPFHFNLPDWKFQDRIPTFYSEYTLSQIPFYEYQYIAQGISKFTFFDSQVKKGISRKFGGTEFYDVEYIFRMEDIPAFKDEAFISTIEDYIMKIDFQLSCIHYLNGSTQDIVTTWEKMSESLLKHDKFGKYINRASKLSKSIFESELSINSLNEEEKAEAIINYMKSNFSWNGYMSKYASKNAKEFYEQKNGTSADINLFLIGLMEAAGIEATPIILSTRDHGKVLTDYPFDHFFNYTLPFIKTEKQSYLTDGTESFLSHKNIPPRCINGKGLLIQKDNVNWVKLGANSNSTKKLFLNFEIDTTEYIINTKGSIKTSGYEALEQRKEFNGDTTKVKDELEKRGIRDAVKIEFTNQNDTEKHYDIKFAGKSSLDQFENKIIIRPFLHFPLQENLLKQKTRSYPVDLIYPYIETIQSSIKIPNGFKLFEKPENYKMDNSLANIEVTYNAFNNIISASSRIVFKKSTYPPETYTKIKSYFDKIVKKLNEDIILIKQ